jgi:hypothetical protein
MFHCGTMDEDDELLGGGMGTNPHPHSSEDEDENDDTEGWDD